MIDLDTEKNRLQQLVVALMDAQERKDLEGVLALVADEALLLRPNQPVVRGLDAWRHDYKRYFRTSISEIITPLKREVAANGDLAWEYGEYHGTSEGGDGPVAFLGKYISVLEKVGGEWRIAAVSLSP